MNTSDTVKMHDTPLQHELNDSPTNKAPSFNPPPGNNQDTRPEHPPVLKKNISTLEASPPADLQDFRPDGSSGHCLDSEDDSRLSDDRSIRSVDGLVWHIERKNESNLSNDFVKEWYIRELSTKEDCIKEDYRKDISFQEDNAKNENNRKDLSRETFVKEEDCIKEDLMKNEYVKDRSVDSSVCSSGRLRETTEVDERGKDRSQSSSCSQSTCQTITQDWQHTQLSVSSDLAASLTKNDFVLKNKDKLAERESSVYEDLSVIKSSTCSMQIQNDEFSEIIRNSSTAKHRFSRDVISNSVSGIFASTANIDGYQQSDFENKIRVTESSSLNSQKSSPKLENSPILWLKQQTVVDSFINEVQNFELESRKSPSRIKNQDWSETDSTNPEDTQRALMKQKVWTDLQRQKYDTEKDGGAIKNDGISSFDLQKNKNMAVFNSKRNGPQKGRNLFRLNKSNGRIYPRLANDLEEGGTIKRSGAEENVKKNKADRYNLIDQKEKLYHEKSQNAKKSNNEGRILSERALFKQSRVTYQDIQEKKAIDRLLYGPYSKKLRPKVLGRENDKYTQLSKTCKNKHAQASNKEQSIYVNPEDEFNFFGLKKNARLRSSRKMKHTRTRSDVWNQGVYWPLGNIQKKLKVKASISKIKKSANLAYPQDKFIVTRGDISHTTDQHQPQTENKSLDMVDHAVKPQTSTFVDSLKDTIESVDDDYKAEENNAKICEERTGNHPLPTRQVRMSEIHKHDSYGLETQERSYSKEMTARCHFDQGKETHNKRLENGRKEQCIDDVAFEESIRTKDRYEICTCAHDDAERAMPEMENNQMETSAADQREQSKRTEDQASNTTDLTEAPDKVQALPHTFKTLQQLQSPAESSGVPSATHTTMDETSSADNNPVSLISQVIFNNYFKKCHVRALSAPTSLASFSTNIYTRRMSSSSSSSSSSSTSSSSSSSSSSDSSNRNSKVLESVLGKHVTNQSVNSVASAVLAENMASLPPLMDSARLAPDFRPKRREINSTENSAMVYIPRLDGERKSAPAKDDSFLKSAVPFLPVPLAVACLILNIIIPGSGTALSGLAVLCCGQSRLSKQNDQILTTLCANCMVGLAQLFTTTFLLVGWFWSIAWGVRLVLLSVQHQKDLNEQKAMELEALALSAYASPKGPPKFGVRQ